VLPHSPELLELRARRERAQEAFDEQRAELDELLRLRDELEQRVLEGEDNADQELPRLNLRLARAHEAIAAAADELAGSTIAWARYVEQAAADAQEEARAGERDLNRSNGLHKRHLYRGTGEIPGARAQIEQALAASEPLRERQRDAARLKADARSRLKRLLSITGTGQPGHNTITQARRGFVERARAEAAARTTRRDRGAA
jgi:hypothetical protein